jgi:hypothetical protein
MVCCDVAVTTSVVVVVSDRVPSFGEKGKRQGVGTVQSFGSLQNFIFARRDKSSLLLLLLAPHPFLAFVEQCIVRRVKGIKSVHVNLSFQTYKRQEVY